jgi:hypothetical protein
LSLNVAVDFTVTRFRVHYVLRDECLSEK